MTVDEILDKHYRPESLLGVESVKPELLADLAAQRTTNNRIYAALFAVICVIFLLALAALATDLVQGEKNRILLLSAAGVPIPFLLSTMKRVAQQWSQSSLLITLISHSDERTTQMIIKKLVNKTL